MIVGRENLKFFEDLASRQTRIYEDACDVGVKINHQLLSDARAHLQNLRSFYKSTITRWGDPKRSHGSSTKLFIPYEMTGSEYRGVTLTVTYNKDVTRRVEFFTVDIVSDSKTESPFN